MAFLRIRNLTKSFGPVVAVNDLNLDIEEGEFFTLLGASGCGKTTTLRAIGGLEKPDEGEIYLGERCLVSRSKGIFVNPEKREMGMVFQSYALWPHMTVFENVAYPLKLRWEKKPVIREKVGAALELVGLRGLEDRPAPALSGGQQQRVALARALVFSPRVLLLDEPLSNLDARLRDEMRQELKALQRRVGITMVFVTHDQIEALSLSDRIAIMQGGRLLQVGTPEEVYHRPTSAVVRDFLGKIFSLSGRIVEAGDRFFRVAVQGSVATLTVPAPAAVSPDAFKVGQEVLVAIRPEKVALWNFAPNGKNNLVQGTLESVHFLGDRYEYTVRIGEKTHLLILPALESHKAGEKIFLELKQENITLWPATGTS
ncbi:MAG TPA: ABC transporter ATP-binding protein [Candidatus Acidoferrales bacterium]|nr:ABC transporter ATP-binding protein [Candidatus Acidoferrales bacterium]